MTTFIEKSQPREKDTDTEPEATAAPHPGSLIAQIDHELRSRVQMRMTESRLSQADVARSARISTGLLNKWLNKKPEGDWRKMEDVLNQWEAEFDKRIDLKRENAPTVVTDWVCRVITSVARTNDLGVLTGPAGVGKTCGAQLFVADNPSAILLTAGEKHGDADSMIRDLWDRSHARKRSTELMRRKSDILLDRFKGSDQPIILDEFHELTPGGLRWVKTFHSKTDCPMVLVGNECGLDKIRRLQSEDQFTSRVGQLRRVPMKNDAIVDLSLLMLKQFAPQFKDELLPMAKEVCAHRGHARRLKKQLRLMLELLTGGLDKSNERVAAMRQEGQTDAQIAFRLAASQLLTLEK